MQTIIAEVNYLKNRKNKNKKSPLVESIISDWQNASDDGLSDVLGSYTGNPEIDEQPIQDADDL